MDVSLRSDNRSRGYATVLLATAEDAGRAINLSDGYSWQTRVLEVRPDHIGASPDPDAHFTQSAISSLAQLPSINGRANGLHDLAKSQPSSDLLTGNTGMRSFLSEMCVSLIICSTIFFLRDLLTLTHTSAHVAHSFRFISNGKT